MKNGCPARPLRDGRGGRGCPGKALSEGRSLGLLERLPHPDLGPGPPAFVRPAPSAPAHPPSRCWPEPGSGGGRRQRRFASQPSNRPSPGQARHAARFRSRPLRSTGPPSRVPASRPGLSFAARGRPRDEPRNALRSHRNRGARARQGLFFPGADEGMQMIYSQHVKHDGGAWQPLRSERFASRSRLTLFVCRRCRERLRTSSASAPSGYARTSGERPHAPFRSHAVARMLQSC